MASTLLTCATRPLPEADGNDPALRALVAVFVQGVSNRVMDALRRERAAIDRVTLAQVNKLAHWLFRLETFRWVVSGERKAAEQAFEAAGYGKLRKFSGEAHAGGTE